MRRPLSRYTLALAAAVALPLAPRPAAAAVPAGAQGPDSSAAAGAVGSMAPQESGRAAGAARRSPPDSVIDELTVQVASQLRCVVCQGLSVQASPSELAKEMKRLIREQLAAGRTPEQVKAYFVARYGEFVLLEPKPAGFNLLVYLLPLGLLLGGLGLIVVLVRRWTGASPADEVAPAPEPGALAGTRSGEGEEP